MGLRRRELHPTAREFEEAELGDRRRTARLVRMVDALARQPDASFPKVAGSDVELESYYRFLSNRNVGASAILAPHQRETKKRASKAREVVVIHDTTEFQLGHADPAEVGYLATNKPGFLGHVSLVVSADGQRRPLGVSSLETVFRMKCSGRGGRRASGDVTTKRVDRESARWERGIEASEALLSSATGCSPIHVADREADSYRLLALLAESKARFVIRIRHDRRARLALADDDDAPWSHVKELIAAADTCALEREVPLSHRRSSRAPDRARARPPRKGRMAKLRFATTRVELRRPHYFGDPMPQSVAVNCVRVYEVDVPEGEEPVEWMLVTSEPVVTTADVERVVDLYRTRWTIEEFFKALKSGCIYEERQLESRRALLNALAVSLPIACHLLWLRSRAQHAPDAPATEVLSLTQILVLRAVAKRPVPQTPSARDVLWAIAGLGGHLKANGEPGWATIRHGLQRLLDFEIGFRAHRRKSSISHGNCDQS
jgi:hypothetical protein